MPQLVDQHIGVLENVEDLPFEKLIAEFPVGACLIAVLPGALRLEVEGFHVDPVEPVPAPPWR